MEADLNQRRPFRAEQDQEAVGLEDVPHPPLPNDDSSSTEANPNADAYDPYLTEEQKQNKEEEEKKRNSQDLICRICFEGRSEDELGKLFSPCKCRGTMKYVHSACLSQWRNMSQASNSFVRCDQCHTPYKFRKSKFIGVLTNNAVLLLMTTFIFIFMALSSGAIISAGLDSSAVTQNNWDDEAYCGWLGCGLDDYTGLSGFFHTFRKMDSKNLNLLSDNLGKVIPIKGADDQGQEEMVVVLDDHFVDILELPDGGKVFSEESREIRWFQSLIWEYKFGRGGAYETEHLELLREVEATSKRKLKEGNKSNLADEDSTNLKKVGTAKIVVEKMVTREELNTWTGKLAKQFSLGLSFIGLASLPFSGFGSLLNFGINRSILRRTRRRDDDSPSQLVAVLFVLAVVVGLLFTFSKTFSFVKRQTRKALNEVEDLVLDWQE